jgi:hypothetical protein
VVVVVVMSGRELAAAADAIAELIPALDDRRK